MFTGRKIMQIVYFHLHGGILPKKVQIYFLYGPLNKNTQLEKSSFTSLMKHTHTHKKLKWLCLIFAEISRFEK